MRSPRVGPKRTKRVQVPVAYRQMVINTEFDIDDNDHNDHLATPTYINNLRNNLALNSSTTLQQKRTYRSQTSLFDYLPPQFQDRYGSNEEELINQAWGDSYKQKSHNNVRIWYTNPNGLGINPTGSKSHSTFSFLYHKSMSDITCLAETNLNWPILQYNSRLNNRLRSFYREFYSSSSNNRHKIMENVNAVGHVLLLRVNLHIVSKLVVLILQD